ncbi:MAG: ferritin family protein [Bacillota bacterium]
MDQSMILNMLLEAYRDEREADAFYTALLSQTEDYEAVEALAEARRDERKHARIIRDLILALAESPPQETTPQLPAYTSFEDAIRIALADERQAVEFYGSIINVAQDARIRDAFIAIREDEIVHALKFEALLYELQEENTPAPKPGYSPEL